MALRSRRSTSGRRRCAWSSVKRLDMPGASDTGDLDRDRPAARAIELRQDDALPGSEQHARIAYLQAQALPHDHAAQMRIGILALAIGKIGIVVPPGLLAIDQIFQKA